MILSAGVYKVTFNLIFFPTPIFFDLISFPKFSEPGQRREGLQGGFSPCTDFQKTQ